MDRTELGRKLATVLAEEFWLLGQLKKGINSQNTNWYDMRGTTVINLQSMTQFFEALLKGDKRWRGSPLTGTPALLSADRKSVGLLTEIVTDLLTLEVQVATLAEDDEDEFDLLLLSNYFDRIGDGELPLHDKSPLVWIKS